MDSIHVYGPKLRVNGRMTTRDKARQRVQEGDEETETDRLIARDSEIAISRGKHNRRIYILRVY